MNFNFMVKVEDAKAVDIQKALQAAGISVRSVVEIHKEDTAAPEKAVTAEGGKD